MMKYVIVVTGFELGWDNVIGVFDPETVTKEQLDKRFPEDRYYVQTVSLETNMEIWED